MCYCCYSDNTFLRTCMKNTSYNLTPIIEELKPSTKDLLNKEKHDGTGLKTVVCV